MIVRATDGAREALEAARRRRVAQLLGLLEGLTDAEWERLDGAVGSLESAVAGEGAGAVGSGEARAAAGDGAVPTGAATGTATAAERAGTGGSGGARAGGRGSES